ncbi:uncharacterized protein LOC100906240 [Galendromus occidentalis]|uniref:Uncharacterized protein LOC100906240 n=1 Tax=Galendromus occidentalis TaxID=34638 RepID=A0AAJ6QM65_9ACAR|nr:uncharacterized protein LOC100906240 [Galendromus occidentalis]
MKSAVLAEPAKSLREVYTGVLTATVNTLRVTHNEEEIGAAVPGFESVRSVLQRSRAKVRPLLPRSREEIDLDARWTHTLTGARFLLFDDGSINRILGFSTNELITSLCEASTVFMDGTFRVVPTIFTQLYSLHGFFKGEMVPFVYFLLPDKSKETYVRMFNLVKRYAMSIGKSFDPPAFQLDFEISALKALEECFPRSEREGSLFHFNQSLWRKVRELRLSAHYGDSEVKRFIRCTAALALVPLDRVEDAWLEIKSDSPTFEHPAYQKPEDFKMYFINTWMENETVFPRKIWNQYRNFGARTTNHLEGWHQALNRDVKRSHVNLFEMIEHLQKQEDKFRLDMMRLRMGQGPPTLTKVYRRLNDRLIRLTGEFESGARTLLDYVRGVAHNPPSM